MIRVLFGMLIGAFIGYVVGVNRDMVVINDRRGRTLWDDRRLY